MLFLNKINGTKITADIFPEKSKSRPKFLILGFFSASFVPQESHLQQNERSQNMLNSKFPPPSNSLLEFENGLLDYYAQNLEKKFMFNMDFTYEYKFEYACLQNLSMHVFQFLLEYVSSY